LVEENCYSDGKCKCIGSYMDDGTCSTFGHSQLAFFGTILLRESGKTRSASFQVIAIVLLKTSSCKDKALERGNLILQDDNPSGL